MKRILIALAAGGAALATTASAAPWQSVNQRQQLLYQQIDLGVRAGELTNNEASQLRREFQEIRRIEAQFRAGGLSLRERADLDHRLRILSQRIAYQRRDNEMRRDRGYLNRGYDDGYGGWRSIDARQDALYRRIDQGVRNGHLTSWEAARLRQDFTQLARMEDQYRRSGGGLSDYERRELDRRLDLLSQRIREERRDDDDLRVNFGF